NPATYGATVTLTAQVNASPSNPTTGQGAFYFYDTTSSPNVLIAGPVAVDSTGKAITTTNTLSQGTHNLQANFVPTPVSSPFAASTGVTAAVINAFSSTFTANVPSGLTAGQPVQITVTGTAAANGAVPSGTLTFNPSVGSAQTQNLLNGS